MMKLSSLETALAHRYGKMCEIQSTLEEVRAIERDMARGLSVPEWLFSRMNYIERELKTQNSWLLTLLRLVRNARKHEYEGTCGF